MSASPEDAIVGAAWAALHDDPTVFDAAMFLAALRAAGYVVEQGWQDISPAPKDGTRIQCYAPAVDDRAAVVRVDYWWVRERGFAHMRPIQPYTHWRPLPAPPG